MKPTDEQHAVFSSCADLLRVIAFSGTGKTSTLIMYAQRRMDERILYVAYNRAMRDEAKTKFPLNTICKTSHQLAWPGFGAKYKHKLVGGLKVGEVYHSFHCNGWLLSYIEIRHAIDTINAYTSSASETIGLHHTPLRSHDRSEVLRVSERLWARMCDENDQEIGMTHDGYLKLFQLSKPALSGFDTILFDEAQDANPVTTDIIMRQHHSRKIFVGDPHQQLYRFRGAEDALERLSGAETRYLTHSFRFGPDIASVANAILSIWKGEKTPLIGVANHGVLQEVPCPTRHTALHRTFVATFDTAADFVERDRSIAWVGGIQNYNLRQIEDLYHLYTGDRDAVFNRRLLSTYASYSEYKDAAAESEDPEMVRICKVVEERQHAIPEIMSAIYRSTVNDENNADVVLSTAHRSKGLDWDVVRLADDYRDMRNPNISEAERQDEANLMYVSVTRAKMVLQPNSEVLLALDEARRRGLSVPPVHSMDAASSERLGV